MPAEELAKLDFEALGTTCHLFAVGLGRDGLEEAAAWVGEMHRRLTRFEPQSELSRLNASAGGWRSISPELEDLLRQALDAHQRSRGLVNAAVFGSMHAIGYTRPLKLGPTPPATEAARPLRNLPDLLQVAPGRARLEPGAGIDLGGLAKGWMADRLCERLGPNCLANLGGDLFARGRGPRGEGWPVAMGDATVMLANQGAATSSTGRRRWPAGDSGRDLHHLIDPRTGLPAISDLRTVSVVAITALRAEVAAKTALLLGSAEAAGFLAAETLGWWME